MRTSAKQCMVVWNLTSLRDRRAEHLQSKNHEDRIAEKGSTSVTHKTLVHKFIPMPSDEDSGCTDWSGQGMEKARDNPSMGYGKSQEQT